MAMTGIAARGGEVGSSCESVPEGAGRGLPTWDADKMNFGSADEGAWGTTIFWKQVGHSICPPLVVESAVMCWPHTGQANLNSLIGSAETIPYGDRKDNSFLRLIPGVTSFPLRSTFGALEAHEKDLSHLAQRTLCKRSRGRGGAFHRVGLLRLEALAA